MPTERIRQTLSGPIRIEDIENFQKLGWTPVTIEWERKAPASVPAEDETRTPQDPPFGLRVSNDCATLEENPDETEILVTMMELIIQDGPYSSIAQELNRRGFLTRRGSKWSPVSVFEMLPRLIEAGPEILTMRGWSERRQQSIQRRQRIPI